MAENKKKKKRKKQRRSGGGAGDLRLHLYRGMQREAGGVYAHILAGMATGAAIGAIVGRMGLSFIENAARDPLQDAMARTYSRAYAKAMAEAKAPVDAKAAVFADNYAAARAAALFGTPTSDGMIQRATRNGVLRNAQSQITNGVNSAAKVAASARDSYWFSRTRAATIVRNELLTAANKAIIKAWQRAKTISGKAWITQSGDPCPICEANEGQGPIPLGEPFQSGDMEPLAHVNCECVLEPVRGGA
ncbi:MAG: hypothetical protein KGL39_30590 [Patescibacteria group bacterium]|nr:hypothetical protein [Patescibacteria group bacterium]